MVCLEEMDAMGPRVTKGMQVLSTWWPFAAVSFIPLTSFIHHLCGHHYSLTPPPTAQPTLKPALRRLWANAGDGTGQGRQGLGPRGLSHLEGEPVVSISSATTGRSQEHVMS